MVKSRSVFIDFMNERGVLDFTRAFSRLTVNINNFLNIAN